MHFQSLGDLSCANYEGFSETALTRWRVEPICYEKRVLGELGSPSDDSGHQRWMQRLFRTCTRGRRTVCVDRCILRHIHVQPRAEVRRVEEGQSGMNNLEVDLDEVKSKPENEWRAEHR